MNKNRNSGIIFAQLFRLNSISAKKSYFCADIPDTRQTIPDLETTLHFLKTGQVRESDFNMKVLNMSNYLLKQVLDYNIAVEE